MRHTKGRLFWKQDRDGEQDSESKGGVVGKEEVATVLLLDVERHSSPMS